MDGFVRYNIAYYYTAEYKAVRRRRVGEAKGRYRPGTKGREAGLGEAQAEALAQRNAREAWQWWLSVRAPSWWLAEYRRFGEEMRRLRESAVWRRKKHARRARRTGSDDGTLTSAVIGKLLSAARRCCYCGCRLTKHEAGSWKATDATLDHVIPLKRGGVHGISNIAVCCFDCNNRKRDSDFAEWARRLGEAGATKARRLYERRFKAPPEQAHLQLVMPRPSAIRGAPSP